MQASQQTCSSSSWISVSSARTFCSQAEVEDVTGEALKTKERSRDHQEGKICLCTWRRRASLFHIRSNCFSIILRLDMLLRLGSCWKTEGTRHKNSIIFERDVEKQIERNRFSSFLHHDQIILQCSSCCQISNLFWKL